ncbi:hypothetical protein ONS96_000621 [Cadophora gregata f. sp. sojae]|nr:hypothetical protein ONS96_000621 [Cadophora gregata f. sp. sojae]
MQDGFHAAASSNALVTTIDSDPQVSQRDQSSQPPPKRRGRPPKVKKDVSASTSLIAQNYPTTPKPAVATSSRSTRRQSQAGAVSTPLPPQGQPSSATSPATSASRPTRRRPQAASSPLAPQESPSSENRPPSKPRKTRRQSAIIPQDQTADQPRTTPSYLPLPQDQPFAPQTHRISTPIASEDTSTFNSREQGSRTIDTASADPDTIVVEPSQGYHPKEGTLVQDQESAPDSVALIAPDGLHTESPAQTSPASAPPPVLLNDNDSDDLANAILLKAPVTNSPAPFFPPETFAADDQPGRRDTPLLEPTSVPLEGEVLADEADPVESTYPAARRSSSRFSAGELLPEATFISQADMDWADGKDGVYINPPGVKVKKPQHFKKKKHSTLVVFRSPELKDPNRLVNGRDTWQARIMPVVTQARLTSADDAVEQGLIPKLNKNRKAESEGVDLTPRKKVVKKRTLTEGEVDPSLTQEWGEAYPEDDSESEYSGISILEAEVPPVPENPNSWSTAWTLEGAEVAKLNADQVRYDYHGRASSFTPSDSRTPYGSPSPADFDDSAMSPVAGSNAIPQNDGLSSASPDPKLSSHPNTADPSSTHTARSLVTPRKKSTLNLLALSQSPARTYRSPYALPESVLSSSGLADNVESRPSGGGSSQPPASPFSTFGKSATPITQNQLPPATELRGSSVEVLEKFPALKLLQPTKAISSYRSPYAPSQTPEAISENRLVPSQPRGIDQSVPQQDHIRGSSFSQPALASLESIQMRGTKAQEICKPTGPNTNTAEATSAKASPDEVYKPDDVSDFLDFMNQDLSTPSGNSRGTARRGKSSTRARGRGSRGGVRGGRGGVRGKSKGAIILHDEPATSSSNLPDNAAQSTSVEFDGTPDIGLAPTTADNSILPPDTPIGIGSPQVAGNITSTLTGLGSAVFDGSSPMRPQDSFPQDALLGRPTMDYENPSPIQPGIIPTAEFEHVNGLACIDLEQQRRGTPSQSVSRDAGGDIETLETPEMTPSQPKARGNRNAKSKAKAPKSKTIPPLATPRVRLDPEEKLRTKIAEAQDVEIPDGASKFPCIYKEAVGNLVLSADQRYLEFFALNQVPPELPMASMKVFHMNGNPIMSAKGSFPMELHVKTKDERNRKKAYRFTYASSETDVAQNMRTNIVTAMIASEFSAGDFASVAEAQAAKVRPFLCELCGDRFKNPNGLEYHLNKAKTKCNPNWDPEADTGKRVYKRKSKGDRAVSIDDAPRTPWKKKSKVAKSARQGTVEVDDLEGSSTSEDESLLIPRPVRKVTVERVFDSDGEEAPRSARTTRKPKPVKDGYQNADGDSDDSILDWARNNATSGYARTRRSASFSETPRPPRSAKKPNKPKPVDDDVDEDSDASLVEWFEKHGKIDSKALAPSKAGRIYKALNREAEVADQIVKEFTDRIHRGNEEIFGLAITPTSQLATAYEISTAMASKALDSKWYEEVVTQLVQRNEGMFPAENSIWLASAAIWLKQHPFTTVLPESKLCAKAVDDLVASKTFTRVEFEFKDRNRNPRAITRSILTTNGLDMVTDRADLIKELVQETHPKAYVPSQLAPPPSALDKLQAVVARLLPSLTVLADSDDEEREESPIPDFGDDSDEDDFMDEAEGEIESQESENDMDLDEEDDPVTALSEAKKSKKRDRTSTGTGPKRRRDAGHNAKISEGVRRRFAEIRAGGENPYPWNIKTKTNYVSPAERLKINQDKKRRDQELAAAKRSCWGTAPAYMPNAETGAWDQAPTPQGDWMIDDDKESKSRYARRQRLPEPITFLQAPDGSWSVRPFGHGVNPIYSRPSRRAEGNPTSHLYLNRIENSHRPIVYPPVKNRVNLPAIPSKRLLEAMESGRPIDEKTGLPIVSRYATRKRRASSAISPENDDEPTPKRNRRAASVRFAGIDSDGDFSSAKISRATGKPPRRYSRNFPKQVFVPDLNHPRISGATPTRKSVRKPKFTEVEILNFYEPKKLTAGAPRNPGLDTIPAPYGLDSPNGDADLNYTQVYNGVIFIAAGFIDENQEPGNSSWTIKHLDTYQPADYSLRWDDATAFTVENLPYSDLQEDCSWIPGFGVPGYGDADYNVESAVDLVSDGEEVVVVEEPKRKRQRKDSKSVKQGKQAKEDRDGKYSYVRQHTALAMDFIDLFEDPVAAGKYFGVEIGTPSESTLKRSRNLGSNIMLPDMESRFAVSVMVIRILTGGLDLQIDWILVSQIFPEYSLNFLKKVWNGILLRKKEAIPRLEDQFRERFLIAYQENEIPRIDYGHLTEYPWADLVDWVMKSTDCSLNNKTIFLPPTREDVVEDYDLREVKEDGCPWRENYFSITTAVYKRIMASAAVPHSISLQPRKRRRSFDEEIDDFAVCRSWVRAAAITPNEDWDRDLAKNKLASFNKSLLSDVLDSLTSQKIVKKRAANKAKNGRVYEIHDTWSTSLRRHMKENQFVEAVTFKRWMDAQFASGVQSVKADYFANEGTIMCITSLQAHGRIRFVGANIPMNKFGLGDGGYETKKIPKERLRFNIDIFPTSSYIPDEANPVLSNILFRDPPRGGENGEIPIWYGLTGKPIWRVWYKILAAVGQVVALRAGVNLQGLKESFRVALEDWEWRLFMEWGAEVGVFDRLGSREDGSEGWSVGEWWWAVVGTGWMDGEGFGGGLGGDSGAVL